jgi:glycosyltransferase involved in cell wall biosynthesis
MTGKLVVGTVARLSSEKGIDVLIRAFAEVHRNIPGTHLLIVGDGMQMADLQQLARDLDVVNAITWAGRLSWEEAIGCMGIMNVVAVPSRFEGFGLTAVEAMACGKPVVASSVDGLSEVVRDGVTGFLTPSSDASALAGALIKLLEKEDLRKKLGCSARKHAKEHFAYPIFRERCRVLYDSLTPRGNFA